MGGVCTYSTWTCRPVWTIFLFLATLPYLLDCTEGPAAAVGKMYPRGNHWAVASVGQVIIRRITPRIENNYIEEIQQALQVLQNTCHLMGKKSTESLETNSDYLTPSETARVTELDRYQGLLEALMQQKNPQQMMPKPADRLLRLRNDWRGEERDKYLREMSHLFPLDLKLPDNHLD